MARRKVKKDDYEALGEWLLNYWQQYTTWVAGGNIGPQPEPDLDALKELVDFEVSDTTPVIYDETNKINILIPLCPWSQAELSDPKSDANAKTYKRELGIVIMGGCR